MKNGNRMMEKKRKRGRRTEGQRLLLSTTHQTMSSLWTLPTLADACVVALVIAIIVAYVWSQRMGEVLYVTSKVDGRQYLCLKLPDRQKAADILGRVNQRLQTLVDRMQERYGTGHSCHPGDVTDGAGGVCVDSEDVLRLVRNYSPDAVSEGGDQKGYTSYSVNKGERMVICVRNTDSTRSFVALNTVMYVAIHELGHLMTADVGHTPRFWHNFKQLLAEAVEMGIYDRVDYAASPQPYCGITISSTVIKK